MPILRRVIAIMFLGCGFAAGTQRASTARVGETTQRDVRQESDTLLRQLQEVELELEKMKRLMPPAVDSAFETYVNERATGAGLSAIEIERVAAPEAVSLDDGRPSGVELRRLDLSGRDQYQKVHLFLVLLAQGRASRVIDFQTLSLKAEAGETVSLRLRVALAVWRPEPPKATPSVNAPRSTQEAALRMVELERAMLLEQRSLLRTLVQLGERSQPAHLVDALAALDHAAHDRAVALTAIRFAGETVIEGVVLGASARAALKPTLEKAGFAVRDLRMSPAGECQAFSVTARLKAGDLPTEVVVGNGVFADGTAAVCRPEPAAAASHVVATSRSTSAKAGAITVRLRDVELGDVFRVLHDLTSQNFVVDADVNGRVNVDADEAALEDVLAGMNTAGVTVGPEPLRRVSRAAAGRRAISRRAAIPVSRPTSC